MMFADALQLAAAGLAPLPPPVLRADPEWLRMIAGLVRDGARFDLSPDVVAAVDQYHASPAQLHQAVAFARPPYPVTWLECAVHTQREVVARSAYLVLAPEDGEEGFRVTWGLLDRDGAVGGFPPTAHVHSTGIEMPRLSPDAAHELRTAAGIALRVLLLMHSRSQVVEVGPAPDMTRLNRARAKHGRPALLGVQPVTWRLTRTLAQQGRRGEAISREAARAHLVRGHFKVRKTGVFWWSPYGRGGAVEGGRDYTVR